MVLANNNQNGLGKDQVASKRMNDPSTSAANPSQYLRVSISCTLKALSRLHIGDGSNSEATRFTSEGTEKSLVNSITLDAEGYPYIPGSSLRGVLLHLAQSARKESGDFLDKTLVEKWFGVQKPQTHQDAQIGQLRIYDAPLNRSSHCERPLMSRTAIEPLTNTAKSHNLFTNEMVERGAEFTLNIHLESNLHNSDSNILEEELNQFLSVLNTLNNYRIGKGKSIGQGVIGCEDIKAKTLSSEELQDWLTNSWQNRSDPSKISRLNPASPFNSNIVALELSHYETLRFSLSCDSPLLINNPWDEAINKPKSKREDGDPSLVYLKDANNNAIIPGSTIKGWWRARCRRILLTILHARENTISAEKPSSTPESKAGAVDRVLDDLFGSTEAISKLWFDDVVIDKRNYREHVQTFTAIDRFTGGVKEHALYKVHAMYFRKEVQLNIFVNTSLTSNQKLIFDLALKDAMDGDMVLGWGKSKGFGCLSVNGAPDIKYQIDSKEFDNVLAQLHQEENQLLLTGLDSSSLNLKKMQEPLSSSQSSATSVRITSKKRPQQANNPALQGGNFFNPYHFIPVKKGNDKNLFFFENLTKEQNRFIRHDFWHKDALSGRINCTITSKSPFIVGNEHQEGNKETQTAGRVKQYCSPKTSKAAIPANSLRGMVGSIAEAISASSLRVLDNPAMSLRKPVNEALKDIGIIVLKKNGGAIIFPYVGGNKENITLSEAQDKTTTLIDQNKVNKLTRDKENLFIRHDIYFVRGVCKEVTPDNRLWELKLTDSEWSCDGFEVSSETLKTFNSILKQTQKDLTERGKDFSVMPKGYEDMVGAKSGHLIYFKLNKQKEVVELSYSQIWRKAVKGDIHTAFENMAGENAIPWQEHRKALTPAEQLLGVVEDNITESAQNKGRNLASRVRFTDALNTNPISRCAQGITLKILAEPKPPSPAMYFNKNGQYIKKTELNLEKREYRPNGRKWYLPHKNSLSDNPEAIWETNTEDNNTEDNNTEDNIHLKVQCTPLDKGNTFEFHIYFDNLSGAELTLLLSAIDPNYGSQEPDNGNDTGEFIHRLGLGKPIGLGHMVVNIDSVETINRVGRYRLGDSTSNTSYEKMTNFIPDTSLIDDEILAQLKFLANPDNFDAPICYPYLNKNQGRTKPAQSAYNEKDGYRWFVENDRVNGSLGHIWQSTSPHTAKLKDR